MHLSMHRKLGSVSIQVTHGRCQIGLTLRGTTEIDHRNKGTHVRILVVVLALEALGAYPLLLG